MFPPILGQETLNFLPWKTQFEHRLVSDSLRNLVVLSKPDDKVASMHGYSVFLNNQCLLKIGK